MKQDVQLCAVSCANYVERFNNQSAAGITPFDMLFVFPGLIFAWNMVFCNIWAAWNLAQKTCVWATCHMLVLLRDFRELPHIPLKFGGCPLTWGDLQRVEEVLYSSKVKGLFDLGLYTGWKNFRYRALPALRTGRPYRCREESQILVSCPLKWREKAKQQQCCLHVHVSCEED